MFTSKHTVYQGTASLRFDSGRLVGVLQPGIYRFWGGRTTVLNVDLRPQRTVVGGQEVSSKDGAAFRVSVVVAWRVSDPERAYQSGDLSMPDKWHRVHDPESQGLRTLVQVAIREWVMSRTFREIFDGRLTLGADLLAIAQSEATRFGIEVDQVELLDMNVSGSLRATLAEALKTELEGEIALARARNEAATMRNLLNTARLVREHPKLLELRVLASGQKPRVTFVVSGDGDVVTAPESVAEQG